MHIFEGIQDRNLNNVIESNKKNVTGLSVWFVIAFHVADFI